MAQANTDELQKGHTIRMTDELWEMITELAWRRRQSVSTVIREGMTQWCREAPEMNDIDVERELPKVNSRRRGMAPSMAARLARQSEGT